MSPLSPLAEYSLFNLNDPLTPLLPAFALDIATDPKAAELLIPNEIITLPDLSDPPLLLINDIDPHIVLPEPKFKLNTPPFPLTDEPTDILVSLQLLTNDSPPTIVSSHSLLNDDRPNVKLNNSQLLSDDASVLIIIGPLVPFSPNSTSTIIGPAELDDEIPVLTKLLPLSPFTDSPLFNINDPLTPLLPLYTLSIATDSKAVELLILDKIITLPYLSDPPLPSRNDMHFF